MFSAVVTILLTNSSSAMGGNCEDKLVGNSYDCVFELSNGTTETTCVDFEMGGSPRLLIFIAFAMTWTTDARARRHALSSRLRSMHRDEAGLTSFRLHDLRHVFVSKALALGIPIHTVGELVGHSSAYMTSRYGHLCNRVAADAAQRIGAALAPTKPSAPPADTNGAANHA